MPNLYTGKTCPFCQFPIKSESNVAVCSECGIPHHPECWQENGRCTSFGCRGKLNNGTSKLELNSSRLSNNLSNHYLYQNPSHGNSRSNFLIPALAVSMILLFVIFVFVKPNSISFITAQQDTKMDKTQSNEDLNSVNSSVMAMPRSTPPLPHT